MTDDQSSTDTLDLVRDKLSRLGLSGTVKEFPEGTGTAAEAAAAVGCHVDQIAKSIVFSVQGKPLIVVASGGSRIDKKKLSSVIGAKLHSVGRQFIETELNLVPGGVTPLAVPSGVPVVIDRQLASFQSIWISAGSPTHVVELSPIELIEKLGAPVIEIS